MAEKHYKEQVLHTRKYLLPYFTRHVPSFRNMKVLEIGCAEGGLLAVLDEHGIKATGVELSRGRVELGKALHPHLDLVVGDITKSRIVQTSQPPYELIILRDVIEHIADREALFSNLTQLLEPKGMVYITFPPKYSPFAGHQQNGASSLRFIPYLPLIPELLLKRLWILFNEREEFYSNMLQNYREGISISQFETYTRNYKFQFLVKELFIIRPIYKTRFGLEPHHFPDIPIIREVCSFGCECLLQFKGAT